MQTANPANYGGEELHLGFGANFKLNIFPGGNDVLGIEILTPLMQDKNNLQMKTDYQVIVGYQKVLESRLKKINLKSKFSKFNDLWSPKVIAEMNDYQFKLVKIKNDFTWHAHEDTDEVFIVIEGACR